MLKAAAAKAADEAAAAHANEVASLRAEADRAARAHERELAAVRSGAERSAKETDDEHARTIAELRTAAAEAARRNDAANAERLAAAEAGIAAARADAEWLRGRLSDLLADVSRRFPKPAPAAESASPAEPESAEPEPATPAEPEPDGPESEPDARASADDVFVEAEAIDEPPPGFRRLRVHPVPDPAAARAAEEPRAEDPPRKPRTGMAALEDQLKDELRRAAGAAPSAGRATGSKIMDFFKRK